MVPILINKDVFESSYDLKFIVQNCNYSCTNLIDFWERLRAEGEEKSPQREARALQWKVALNSCN